MRGSYLIIIVVILSASLLLLQPTFTQFSNFSYGQSTGTSDGVDVDGYVILATISVGKNPDGVEINPLTNIIYVANTGDSTVSVIDLNTGEPVEEELPIPSESDVMPEEETPELPEQASEIAQNKVPEWIKNNACLWADGSIDDDAFVQGIQYLIEEKIMNIPDLPEQASTAKEAVPDWVKNNAGWWAEGVISEDEFVN